jgi:thiamine-phosphate pyrophosphorylase
MKDVEEALMEETAIAVQRMCREYGATFIIDDNVALAKRIGADGVHLGKHDMPIATAREILGDGYIIGATVNTFEDVLHHMEATVPDYFGCGPFRETTTKRNLSPRLGVDGYRNIIHKMRGSGIDIPVVAIGGIRKEDIPLLLECGISGIALSSSILTADDPVAEMQEIVNLIFK